MLKLIFKLYHSKKLYACNTDELLLKTITKTQNVYRSEAIQYMRIVDYITLPERHLRRYKDDINAYSTLPVLTTVVGYITLPIYPLIVQTG